MTGRRIRAAGLSMAVGLGAAAVAGAGSPVAAAAVRHASGAATLQTPLATSVTTAQGSWTTLPMGRTGQATNTFWQLFFRPAGGAVWSNEVEATAVATNGGIVLAPRDGRSLVAGVLPSHLLEFSPLITTSDGASHWSNGILPSGLAGRPAALAAGTAGTLALVDGSSATRVLESRGSLSSWRTITTATSLAASVAGRSCGVEAITAVGFAGATPLVGASCTRTGVVGIFADRGGRWRLAGPDPGASDAGTGSGAGSGGDTVAHGRSEVLSLTTTGGHPTALVGVVDGGRTSVVAAWDPTSGDPTSGDPTSGDPTSGDPTSGDPTSGDPTAGDPTAWGVSAPLPLGSHARLASYGPTDGSGLFVLVDRRQAGGRGTLELATAGGPGEPWQRLAAPPAGTQTVAFGPGGAVTALAGRGSVLTVWSLSSSTAPPGGTTTSTNGPDGTPTTGWTEHQVLHVAISYGSST